MALLNLGDVINQTNILTLNDSTQTAQIAQLQQYVSQLQSLTGSLITKDNALSAATGSLQAQLNTNTAIDTGQTVSFNALSASFATNVAGDLAQQAAIASLSSSLAADVSGDAVQQQLIQLNAQATNIKILFPMTPAQIMSAFGVKGVNLQDVIFRDINLQVVLQQNTYQMFTTSQTFYDYVVNTIIGSDGYTTAHLSSFMEFRPDLLSIWPERYLVLHYLQNLTAIWDLQKLPGDPWAP